MKKEYEEYIKKDLLCDFMQSLSWNKIKTYWQNEQIIIKRNNKIVLVSNILIRNIPFFGSFIYIPRGPIGNINNKEYLEEFTYELKRIAKKYHAFKVLMEPNIEKNNEQWANTMKELGYKINSNVNTFDKEIQARHNFRLNLQNKTEEEVFSTFSSKTRYNIRLASKKGIVIKEKKKKDLKEFYQILVETGKRDNFIARPMFYYENIFNQFEDVTLLMAYYNELPIAGVILLTYGKKTWYLYGASSNEYRNFMPNYLLQWESIKRAIKKESILYDFLGCSMKDNKPDGLYRFKKGFGTDFIELIGEVSLEIKPIKSFLYNKCMPIYFKLRGYQYRLKKKKNKK